MSREGRQLDAHLHRQVFGEEVELIAGPFYLVGMDFPKRVVPHYTTDRLAALDLAEAMRAKEHQVILYFWPDDYPLSERYGCHILSTLSERGSGERQDADTLPLAICRAIESVFEGKEKEHGDN